MYFNALEILVTDEKHTTNRTKRFLEGKKKTEKVT